MIRLNRHLTRLFRGVVFTAALVVLGELRGAVITVTTTNNTAPPAGSMSLMQALTAAQQGDTIQFNIPGAGPHFILTPLGGYPLIRANNVTVDGYSQPGSSTNSNPILGGNNAVLKIVLDSRGDESSGDPATPDRRSTRLPYPGYGDSENAILGIFEADNVTIRGLSFLSRQTVGDDADPKIYCVALVKEAKNARLQGCWFGLAPDGTTVAGGGSAVAAFRHRVSEGGVNVDTFSEGLIFGTDGDGVYDPSEFNLALGMHIALALEAPKVRVSGNYFNVYPDGRTFFDVEGLHNDLVGLGLGGGDASVESFENGRVTDDTIIGVNGDGISDSNERNIFAHSVYSHDIEFYSAAPNAVIAGNYFGVGVDGVTTQPALTSVTPDFIELPGTASVRVGSNGDGISDDLEGNLIYNLTGSRFIAAGASVPIVARRNKLVNNSFGGFPFAEGENSRTYEAYYAEALENSTAAVPVLADVTDGIMTGTVPAPNTNIFALHSIDIYVVDAASAANGSILPGTYAGSFVEGSAQDKDPAPNAFKYSLIGLPIAPGAQVAIAVTYSRQPGGSTKGTNSLTGPLSNAVEARIPLFAPGSIESVGLTRIVPDTPIINPGAPSLGNWEPYASVLGSNLFLIEGNTFAEGETDKQRYVVALQPLDGRPMKLGDAFYADDKTAYKGTVNLSRQNGNPGRVAGDKRPGAVNFISGGEVSLHGFAPFQSDNRWTVNGAYSEDHRYAAVQTFALDLATLNQTPLTKAFDPVEGQNTGTFAGNVPEVSRFGGELAALDNGNFVVVIDDRSNLIAPRRTATAAIITPTGQIVKAGFAIDSAVEAAIWSNVAAYRGGFCVRFNASLYFFDNDGNLQGKVSQDTSGESFNRDRGDGTRIAAHINSPYVFLAGKVTTATTVKVAAWDSRDRSFVGVADVSEPAFPGTPDRVNLAVDALNRVVVAWESLPPEYEVNQVAARVLVLNEGPKTITPLTPSFLTFINAAKSGGIHTFRMSVAMTTRRILVAAKGEINLANRPAENANSPTEINFFTVFTHPDPKDDPTTPVGGSVDRPPISIVREGTRLRIDFGGTLETTTTLGGSWTPVAGNPGSPYFIDLPSQGAMAFFQARRP